MSTAAVGGGQDGNGNGGCDSSHHSPQGENTIAAPNPRKMSTFERGMLRHMQGKTTYAIAREEEPP
jgi:hypothetical protein